MDETLPVLSPAEVRVLGSLIEKQIATPDYYPLTLNALTNACNQINNRDPVVSFDEQTVVRAMDGLREKRFGTLFKGAESRVAKYRHSLPDILPLTPAETAVLCVLMLRGPQTLGELRGRTERLYAFENLGEVESALTALSERQPSLVTKLPRQPGTKEARFAHLLAGTPQDTPAQDSAAMDSTTLAVREENERAAKLEEQVAELRRELTELKQQFAEFRKQFE